MRRLTLAAVLAITLFGCSRPSISSPSDSDVEQPTSEPQSPEPSANELPTAGPQASALVVRTNRPSIELPDELDGFAWARVTLTPDGSDGIESSTVSVGRLGWSASFTETIARADGWISTVVAGNLVGILIQTTDRATLEIVDAIGGTRVGRLAFDGWVTGIKLDPDRSVLYAATQTDGEVAMGRYAIEGGAGIPLVSFRVGPQTSNISSEPYGLAVTPTGTFVAIACKADDACRVWTAAPVQAAGAPMELPASTPIICWVVDASDDWLVVEDMNTCGADTDSLPTPLRAISLRDGSSRLLHEGPNLLPGRLVEVDGRAEVMAATRSDSWRTSDVVAIDIESGNRRTLLATLPNANDGASGWFGASGQRLRDPWVLVQTWGFDSLAASEPPPARLLNASTLQVIELPAGTFGWD